jgi:hypothetical protein
MASISDSPADLEPNREGKVAHSIVERRYSMSQPSPFPFGASTQAGRQRGPIYYWLAVKAPARASSESFLRKNIPVANSEFSPLILAMKLLLAIFVSVDSMLL